MSSGSRSSPISWTWSLTRGSFFIFGRNVRLASKIKQVRFVGQWSLWPHVGPTLFITRVRVKRCELSMCPVQCLEQTIHPPLGLCSAGTWLRLLTDPVLPCVSSKHNPSLWHRHWAHVPAFLLIPLKGYFPSSIKQNITKQVHMFWNVPVTPATQIVLV